MEDSLKIEKSETEIARSKGINAALFSAMFLGLAPIFGKQAINLGLNPLGVVAFRTLFATLLLFAVMVIFQRKYLYIYPAGMIGCLLAGWVNGFGSLFYYSALGRIDAGVGQLLYSLYPFFLMFWMYLDSHKATKLTWIRLIIAVPAIYLLIQTGDEKVDIWGVIMMLIGAALYALHLPINQRVLIDIPAPTVTLYTLVSMSAIVVPTYLFSGEVSFIPSDPDIWGAIIALTIVTFLSRLTLFTGIKHLGGMETALLGLSELLVTLALAQIWLGENLHWQQWIGAGLLTVSMFMVAWEKNEPPKRKRGGWFSWLSAGPTAGLPSDIFPGTPAIRSSLSQDDLEGLKKNEKTS